MAPIFTFSGSVKLDANGAGRLVQPIGSQQQFLDSLARSTSVELVAIVRAPGTTVALSGVTQVTLGKLQVQVADCQAGQHTTLTASFANPVGRNLPCQLRFRSSTNRGAQKFDVSVTAGSWSQSFKMKCASEAGSIRGVVSTA
jgi:hypothetical protein